MPNAYWPDQGFGNRGTNAQQATKWNGNVYVKPYSGVDGNHGDSPYRARKSVKAALAIAQANTNSRIVMMAENNTAASTTDYYSTSLLYNVDGTHLIGVNAGPLHSQRSRIAAKAGTDATTGTALAALVTHSANGCYVENIEMFQGYGHANAVGCLHVSGERNHFKNCHFAGMGIAASGGAGGGYSLKLSGSENYFEDCTIGLDTIARTTTNSEILFAANATTGYAPARNHFRKCRIVSYCTGSGTGHVWLKAAAGALDRSTIFEDCIFLNYASIASGVQMTQGFSIGGASASYDGFVALQNCLLIGALHDETSTSGRLFKGQSNSTFNTMLGATGQM